MNKYLVTIMVTVSGYEKEAYQLVQAETMWRAEMAAVKAEAHNEVDLTVSGWVDDIFYYTIRDIVELTEDHFNVLSRYIV